VAVERVVVVLEQQLDQLGLAAGLEQLDQTAAEARAA
jgi:hypothetical protein